MSSSVSEKPAGRYWLNAVMVPRPAVTVEHRAEQSSEGNMTIVMDCVQIGPPTLKLTSNYRRLDGVNELPMMPPRTSPAHDIDEGYASLELSPARKSFCPGIVSKAIEPARKIYWTLAQRLAVCVLMRWYSTKWQTFGAIFKIYFAAELTAVYKSSYMLGLTLRAQWSDIRAGVKYDAYSLVFEETLFSDKKGKWKGLRDSFEEIAVTEGLILERKCENKLEVLDRGNPRKVRKLKAKQRPIIEILHTRERPPGRLQQVVQKRISRQKKRRQEKPFTKSVYNGPPQIGFRSYNEENYGLNSTTGFRAGRYTSMADVVPQPLDMMDAAFDAEADRHLSRNMTGVTSLISVRDNLLPALHDAMHKGNAFIAMINLAAANRQSRAYSAAWAIGRLNKASDRAWHKANQYKGNGEWLVWGEIRQEAVIATFTIKQLYSAFEDGFNRIPDHLRFGVIQDRDKLGRVRSLFRSKPRHISAATGCAIGMTIKFMGVPDHFLSDVVQVIVRDWEIIGDQDPGVRAEFVRCVVVEGFLRSENDETEQNPLFGYRVGRLIEEVDAILWYPAERKERAFGKAKRKRVQY
ncbi:MAG: hypothetical protein M1812_006975 [Candelaria pacifica]|nr:MAG: hypothetical protein M1812_006975 [Candelaria pacifica]